MAATTTPLLAFPQRPEDRLRLALRRLDAALEAQRQAVGAWRQEIAALGLATQALDGSLQGLRTAVGGLAQEAARAGAEAARLERTAEAMLRAAPQ